MKEREFEIKNHLYKGKSIDGKTHYGENVLLIILLGTSVTQTNELYRKLIFCVKLG